MKLLLLVTFSSLCTLSAFASTPAEHALQIAQAQPDVARLYKELKAEAGKISDPRLKKDALEILGTPHFRVVEARKADASEIEKNLRAVGLLAEGAHVFPENLAMPFEATPASPGHVHHSYPGGLLRHELVNLKTALAAAATYRDVYGIHLNEDWLRGAPIWHDSAKTIVTSWRDDGTVSPDETQIAGTGAHHILGVAEAIYRGYDPAFVVVLASAHNPPIAGAGLESLVKYLRAAAMIAGKPLSAAGLFEDGSRLLNDPPIEAFVHHLSDHDWVLSEPAQERVMATIGKTGWDMDAALAQHGDLFLYDQLLKGKLSGGASQPSAEPSPAAK